MKDKYIGKKGSANSATIDTVLKIFKALKADIHFHVTVEQTINFYL